MIVAIVVMATIKIIKEHKHTANDDNSLLYTPIDNY